MDPRRHPVVIDLTEDDKPANEVASRIGLLSIEDTLPLFPTVQNLETSSTLIQEFIEGHSLSIGSPSVSPHSNPTPLPSGRYPAPYVSDVDDTDDNTDPSSTSSSDMSSLASRSTNRSPHRQPVTLSAVTSKNTKFKPPSPGPLQISKRGEKSNSSPYQTLQVSNRGRRAVSDSGLLHQNREKGKRGANARPSLADIDSSWPSCKNGNAEFEGYKSSSRRRQNRVSDASSPTALYSDEDVDLSVSQQSDEAAAVGTLSQRENAMSASNVDDAIKLEIERPLRRHKVRELKEKKTGRIYINENYNNRPGQYYKIGITQAPTNIRRNQHEKKCGDILKERRASKPSVLIQRAEQLCHTHLKNFYRPYTHKNGGKCELIHREYYEIDLDDAWQIVELWTTFHQHVPYDNRGFLRPFWASRLQGMSAFPENQDHHHHEAQIKRWRSFVQLSFCDEIHHDMSAMWSYFKGLRYDSCFWGILSLLSLSGIVIMNIVLERIISLAELVIVLVVVASLYFWVTLFSKLKTLETARLFCSKAFLYCREKSLRVETNSVEARQVFRNAKI